MSAPTSYNYSSIKSYMQAGIIYVHAGCRGRNNGSDYSGGAPWGVTDLKAAIRFIRYNEDRIPGDSECFFAYGHSGGGAQTAVLGASGDSALYTPYLESIGACMTYDDGSELSDALYGACAWCPITSLDMANAAYEWNMGQYMTDSKRAAGTFTGELSADLAEAYARYINELGLTDGSGSRLTLDSTEDGVYSGGSYYDFMLSEINRSLNNYIADNGLQGSSYVSSLGSWVSWDGTAASVSSIDAFAQNVKSASKAVPAFDSFDRGKAENYFLGTTPAMHFILMNWLRRC